jgi:hypothetical protein
VLPTWCEAFFSCFNDCPTFCYGSIKPGIQSAGFSELSTDVVWMNHMMSLDLGFLICKIRSCSTFKVSSALALLENPAISPFRLPRHDAHPSPNTFHIYSSLSLYKPTFSSELTLQVHRLYLSDIGCLCLYLERREEGEKRRGRCGTNICWVSIKWNALSTHLM